jgi:hypothetical protein
MAPYLGIGNITKKNLSQELHSQQGKPTLSRNRDAQRVYPLTEPLVAHSEYARDSMNMALVLSSSLAAQGWFSPTRSADTESMCSVPCAFPRTGRHASCSRSPVGIPSASPPGMDLLVTKKEREEQRVSDNWLVGRRLFGTARAHPLQCPRTRGFRVDG